MSQRTSSFRATCTQNISYEIYERPLSEKEPVVCVDEEPVALHAEVRPPRPLRRAGLPGATRSTNARVQPKCSVEYSPGLEGTSPKSFSRLLQFP
jgi:hypothetical protein